MSKPLRIAVVGHTNVGKTSLLRTLARDEGFGEVDARPSTTRHVEGACLLVDGEPLLELFDTPGLEEPIELYDVLERQAAAMSGRQDGPARIAGFLDSPAAPRFAQEAKVLRQLRHSDAALLVIDVRDPVLAKHRDELALLAMCAVPTLPVLNFVRSDEAREQEWRAVLSRNGLHAQVRFDTVAPELDAESRLYSALIALLPAAEAALQRLLASRAHDARHRHEAARRQVADLLLDAAAAEWPVTDDSETVREHARGELADWLRAREQRLIDQLLVLYRFDRSRVDTRELPLVDGHWQADLLHPELLKQAGVRIGSGVAAGAAAGVGIDLLSAGLTLGAAAAIGAAAGGGAQAVRHYGRRWWDRLRGRRRLQVDDGLLRMLGLRALALIEALEGRGHAASDPVRCTAEVRSPLRDRPLPGVLHKARGRPDWSSLARRGPFDESREAALARLAEQI